MICERCGYDSPFAIFDSSTGSEFFCEKCHRKDMEEHYKKRHYASGKEDPIPKVGNIGELITHAMWKEADRLAEEEEKKEE